ncbi:MAG TPA: DUF3828 domain-containing protein [Pyrinomonadaceae bacterium]|jgi:hypothetical protein
MKITNYLILAAVLIFTINCSSVVKTTQENTNAQNSAAATTPAAAQPTPSAQQASVAPDALVKDLYQQHDKKNSPFFQTKNRALVDKYFDKTLAGAIWKDAIDSKGEVGAIDSDPLYNAQDIQIKNFAVGQPKIENSKATVPVTFENYGRKVSITYELVQKDSAWKIADINYGGGETLMGWLKESAKTDAATGDGNFEGTYQVGDTTCTVKAIKMAYEIKWAKGSGSEIFFSEGRANDRYIFASEAKDGEKSNSFAFDGENFTTGTFYRADGKEFAVKKIK